MERFWKNSQTVGKGRKNIAKTDQQDEQKLQREKRQPPSRDGG